jgi:hypothetical protein
MEHYTLHFIELIGSFLCTQQPNTGPWPEAHEFSS